MAAQGKRLGAHVIQTSGEALVKFLATLPSEPLICMEEGTQSEWLYQMLSPHAREVVVTRVAESRGQKNDELDAYELADLRWTPFFETSGWKRFPPRLREQPIFYPVVQEAYARKIAKGWNVRASGAGFVTRFAVDAEYLGQFEVHEVGGREHAEYWIPAEQLEDFNDHIVGVIEMVAEFRA